MFYCPGCEISHVFYVGVPNYPSWIFNGNLDKPTFTPSLLNFGRIRCHLFLTDGVLRFLSDCGHKLAGKNVSLVDFD